MVVAAAGGHVGPEPRREHGGLLRGPGGGEGESGQAEHVAHVVGEGLRLADHVVAEGAEGAARHEGHPVVVHVAPRQVAPGGGGLQEDMGGEGAEVGAQTGGQLIVDRVLPVQDLVLERGHQPGEGEEEKKNIKIVALHHLTKPGMIGHQKLFFLTLPFERVPHEGKEEDPVLPDVRPELGHVAEEGVPAQFGTPLSEAGAKLQLETHA